MQTDRFMLQIAAIVRPGVINMEKKIQELKERIEQANAVVIGAGSGLSTSAGFVYTGERFEKYFPDFIAKYQFEDMYTGGFYVMRLSPEENWAYWSRYIYINRYMNTPWNRVFFLESCTAIVP